MQHQTIRRDESGRWQGMDCPCREDHGPSVREELDIARQDLASLRALAQAAMGDGHDGRVRADEILRITGTVAL